MKIRYLYLFLLVTLFSCREELIMDDVKNEKLLVVDGFIANTQRPYIINLSYSSLTSEPMRIPYTSCKVTISDDKGNVEELIETEQGSYSTSLTGIQGVIGNKYKLTIKTPEGKEYKSEFQELKAAIGIDSVYAQLEYKQDADLPYDIPGYQFFINTEAALTNDNYFFWTMSETFEYDIDYNLKYIETRFGDFIYSNPRYDTLRTCWKTNNVNYFFTGKTTNLDITSISNKPLHFVNTFSKKLKKRYSLLVNQFVIDKKAYNYWKNIENQISNDDFLSTTQPFNIIGNVKNINNINEKVFGYFTVAYITNKRIFINRPFVPFYYPKCIVITGEEYIRDYKKTHNSPYFYVEKEAGVFGIVLRECIDCRTQGGELSQPDFWTNN